MRTRILILICFCNIGQTLIGQTKEQPNLRVSGLTLAVSDMKRMVDFYTKVFNVKFEKETIGSFELYKTDWLGMKLLLCPAKLAGNSAAQNKHQFEIESSDLEQIIKCVKAAEGKVFNSTDVSVSLYDPDQNSIVFVKLSDKPDFNLQLNKLGRSSSKFLGLRTTIYSVSDILRAKAWYTKVFETEPYFDEPFYVGFNIAGFELGLLPEEKPVIKGEGAITYWGVEDVEKTFKHMLTYGATRHREPHNVGGNIIKAAVKDPWNNIIGIIYNPDFKGH